MQELFQKEIHRMQTDMQEMNGKVDKILHVLTGNPIDKNDGGMVGNMHKLEQRVTKLEKWKDRVVYMLIGASFGAGWTISDILQKFFTH